MRGYCALFFAGLFFSAAARPGELSVPVSVRETAGLIAVNTGPLEFTVNRRMEELVVKLAEFSRQCFSDHGSTSVPAAMSRIKQGFDWRTERFDSLVDADSGPDAQGWTTNVRWPWGDVDIEE